MFTGIVRGLCPVVSVEKEGKSFGRITVRHSPQMLDALQQGDSVSIDGACLTVTSIRGDLVSYDVIQTTLARTIIGEYQEGTLVNVERSMKPEAENGGHEVSGHVDCTAIVETVEVTPNNRCVFFRLPANLGKYLFPRGFIAVNGVSLTVSDCLDGGTLLSVWLIPETLRATNLRDLSVGQRVNVEIHRGVQILVDTLESSVQKFLQDLVQRPSGIGDRAQAIENLAKIFLPRLKGREGQAEI